jgi:hypothetical protein
MFPYSKNSAASESSQVCGQKNGLVRRGKVASRPMLGFLPLRWVEPLSGIPRHDSPLSSALPIRLPASPSIYPSEPVCCRTRPIPSVPAWRSRPKASAPGWKESRLTSQFHPCLGRNDHSWVGEHTVTKARNHSPPKIAAMRRP